mgnify:CR=1 FL=1
MKLTLTKFSYNFDNDGSTSSVECGFQGFDSGNNMNCTVRVTKSDLTEGLTFDGITKKDAESIARNMASNWFENTDIPVTN